MQNKIRTYIFLVILLIYSSTLFAAQVVLVLDVSEFSGIDPTHINDIKEATTLLVDMVPEGTVMGLVTFGSGVRVVQPMTTDRSVMRTAIQNLENSGVTTDYGEATRQAISMFSTTAEQKRIVLMAYDWCVSSMDENGRAAAREAQEAGIRIDSISFGDFGSRPEAMQVLEDMAELSGGVYYNAPTGLELRTIFSTIGESIKTGGEPVQSVVCFPNPFDLNNMGCINFKLGVYWDEIHVEIYNILGQKINSFSYSATSCFEWDGCNYRGKKVASGVYFIIVKSSGGIAKGKFTVIR